MTEKQRIRLKNIILYILNEFSGGTDYIKLYKILYFANRRQLALTGIPLVHDNFKAWDLGPVPSLVGTMVKRIEAKTTLKGDLRVFESVIKVKKNKRIVAETKPDIDVIPKYSLSVLDSVIKKYKYYTSKRLSEESHGFAWDEAYNKLGGKYNGHITINPISAAKEENVVDEMICFLQRFFGDDDHFYLIDDESPALENFEKAVLFLHELSLWPEGWDGEDAFPIERKTVFNCQDILSDKRAHVEMLSDIYPSPTGSVCMVWEKEGNKVSVEVSNDSMAFYYVSANRDEIYDSPIYKFSDNPASFLYHYIDRLYNNGTRCE